MNLIQEAVDLAAQHKIPFASPGDGTLPFLRAIWEVLPANSLISLAAETEYLKHGIWKDTVSFNWFWREDLNPTSDNPLSLYWAAQANNNNYTLPERGGVFWHGAARKTSVLSRFHARGSLDELTYVGCFWADLDCAKYGYTLTQGLDILLSMPLKPSIVTFSGGGLQVIHLFDRAWEVTNREAATEFKAYSLAFYTPYFRDSSNPNVRIDESIHDATRMMRLPGYVNKKESRHGATAQVIYWNPDTRYSPDTIKQYAPLPEHHEFISSGVSRGPIVLESGLKVYRVTREFVEYLVDGSIPHERHPQLLRLTMQAARAGMLLSDFAVRLRAIAPKWFTESESHRLETELDRLLNWGYNTIEQDPESTPQGSYLITLSENNGFELAPLDVVENANDKASVALAASESTKIDANDQIDPIEILDLPTIRDDQVIAIEKYLKKPLNGFGSYLLLGTSPGAGKTFATWQAIQTFAKHWRYDLQEGIGGAAFLGLFKLSESILNQSNISGQDENPDLLNWREYLQSFNVDPNLAYYFVARNGDPTSAGYCALHAQAESVGRKGWTVKQTLCAKCPLRLPCEERYYLAQFKVAARYPILLGRHQHGVIDEILDQRKLIVFDESPLNVVSSAITLTQKDLVWNEPPPYITDQQSNESITLLQTLIEGLARIVKGNEVPKKGEYLSLKHTKLGGKWLFTLLDQFFTLELGQGSLKRLFTNIDDKFIREVSKPYLRDTTPESIADLPINYLLALFNILKHEYLVFYCAGSERWNSRVIPVGNQLNIYPMQPFNFTQNTKVIITDGTAQQRLYNIGFSYPKTIKGVLYQMPRRGGIFNPALAPKAHIIQFTGTDNTRSSVRQSTKKLDPTKDINALNGDVALYEETIDSTALAQTKEMIEVLSRKHNDSLLVVTYKKEAQALRKWVQAAQNGLTLPISQITWFGSLRGKNSYRNLEACLVIGTPRIPEHELMVLSQVWNYQDPIPVKFTKIYRSAKYPGFDKHYTYIGYADDHVNDLYLHLITSEIRQCYERIRPNASDSPRFVYLGAAIPCSDHVSEFASWVGWRTDVYTESQFIAAKESGSYLSKAACVRYVMDKVHVSQNAARASFERVFTQWDSRVEDTAYRFHDKAAQTDMISFMLNGPAPQSTKQDQLKQWFEADPSRLTLSIRQIQQILKLAGITVSTYTIQTVKSTFDDLPAPSDVI